MSEKTKRPWFRFHLSTALALVLVAGGLIGANLKDRAPFIVLEKRNEHGWPLIAKEYFEAYPMSYHFRFQSNGKPEPEPDYKVLKWHPIAVAVDSLVAIGILLSVAFISEWLIRRREGRKP